MGRDYDLESCTHDLELAQQREIVHTNESKREEEGGEEDSEEEDE